MSGAERYVWAIQQQTIEQPEKLLLILLAGETGGCNCLGRSISESTMRQAMMTEREVLMAMMSLQYQRLVYWTDADGWHINSPIPDIERHRYEPSEKSQQAPLKLRREVLARDDYKCAYCDDKGDTVDHIMPVSRGGEHVAENLVACCRSCNSKKGTRTPEEWRAAS